MVIAENGKPIIAKLDRCIEGKGGVRLLDGQRALREQLTRDVGVDVIPSDRSAAALAEARRLGFTDDDADHPTDGGQARSDQ